jgi:hypothetical protein
VNDTFLLNELIAHLGIFELHFKGRSFTGSNMKDNPLLKHGLGVCLPFLDQYISPHIGVSIGHTLLILPSKVPQLQAEI